MAKVAIMLTPGFADWEYAMIGGTGGPFYGLDVQYFAPETGELRSQGGLPARIGQDTEALSRWRPDVIAIIGGTIWASDEAPDIADLLVSQVNANAVVAGICGGTLALARAGLLDTVAHTSNDADFLIDNAKGYRGSGLYRASAAAIREGRVITAPGTAPVSFTAAVLDAAGVDAKAVAQFRAMLAAEHG